MGSTFLTSEETLVRIAFRNSSKKRNRANRRCSNQVCITRRWLSQRGNL